MITRRRFVESATALGGLALGPRVARAQTPTNLRVIMFGVASNLPVWCGVSKGFFAKQNLNVTTEITPNSVYMFEHLAAGDFEIAISAFDNVVAYDEGQGTVPLSVSDFAAFMGGDSGMLGLYCRPELRTYGDLKGQTLAVDAIPTGYTFVLRKMLEFAGLGPNDYKLEAAGGTPKRFEALLAGKYAGTLLTAPFDLEAEAQGCHRVGTATDIVGQYQAYTGLARRAWMSQNSDVLVRYIRGYLAALRWLYDARNKQETIALLTSTVKVPADVAGPVYAQIINRDGGIVPSGGINMAGVRTVLALRSQYGEPKKKLNEPAKYIDDRYYHLAFHR